MDEHRYTCPAHVREFTRYRAHVDFSQDRPPEANASEEDPDPELAAVGEDSRARAESDPMAAR
jgi:hypothetical protein